MIEDESDFALVCDLCGIHHVAIRPCDQCYNECCNGCRIGDLCLDCVDDHDLDDQDDFDYENF